MTVETRPAREEDITEIARLVAAIAAYHESLDARARFDWEEIRQAPAWLKTVLARDHHAVWVADAGGGHLVGYLWVRLLRDHQGYLPRVRGYINHAYLEENWRGKRLMKPMLKAAYEWFLSKGVTVVTLLVLHRNWLGSSAWYKLGYEDWTHERRLELKPQAK
ncbi:MAG TPA: GNAT family N-acetyltransferase [Candidatus Binataceae bacterium]|jgi:GNAT superfamily N-acetyltransferase|nr:GNAT family N-acetyltransferase [Candidatus Binataceae bacterium]